MQAKNPHENEQDEPSTERSPGIGRRAPGVHAEYPEDTHKDINQPEPDVSAHWSPPCLAASGYTDGGDCMGARGGAPPMNGAAFTLSGAATGSSGAAATVIASLNR